MVKISRLLLVYLVVLGALIGTVYGLYIGIFSQGKKIVQRYVICNADKLPDEALFLVNKNPQYIRPIINFLKKEDKLAFCEKENNQEILLNTTTMPTFRSSQSLDIIMGRYFEQDVLCPAEKIQNISIRIAPLLIIDNSNVKIEVYKNEKLIIKKMVSKKIIKNDGRIFIEFPIPILDCQNQIIKIIASCKECSLSMPIYDPYYSGKLYFPNNTDFEKKVLGVEINTPVSLKRYYKTLTYRAYLKRLKNKITN